MFCCEIYNAPIISIHQALHNILSPLGPEDPKAVERQRQLNPSLLDQLIQSNFNTSMLMPTITVDTVHHLKEIISDTLATASSFLEGNNCGSASGSAEVSLQLAPLVVLQGPYNYKRSHC